MQIEQNLIDDIIKRIDIVEYISKHLKLKKSGHTYFACCPFHNEKSASFGINSVKQFFHCFGCGESGDVLTFVMKYNGVDFIDAVKLLAAYTGVYLPENEQKISKAEIIKKKQHKLNLNETINKVVNFYQKNLAVSSIAMHYLHHRGLNNDIIDKFLIGYVPNISNPLKPLFSDYVNNQFLIDAGLTLKNDNGSIYERFRDRIMFPLRNTKGEIIAFGGRIINKGEPKYLNSPETELFNKSLELYGLFESGRQIRDKKYAIVVEGYMDMIALFQFGVDNAVATMGTSVTAEHITKLFNLCDDIYYCFDGDTAGFKAAWRALERSIPLVTDTRGVHFLFLPNGEDPDSYIRKVGFQVFTDQIKNHSLSLTGFLLKQLSSEVNLITPDGKARLINQAKPYVEKLKAVGLQVMLKQQLANMVELPANAVESILNNRSRYAFYTNYVKANPHLEYKTKTPLPVINSIELIIANLLKNPNLAVSYNLPEPDNFHHYSPELQELILLIDYISHNYEDTAIIAVDEIESKLNFKTISLNKPLNNHSQITLASDDFKEILNRIFGLKKAQAIKIPRIKMKETP
jgi:DNA primase